MDHKIPSHCVLNFSLYEHSISCALMDQLEKPFFVKLYVFHELNISILFYVNILFYLYPCVCVKSTKRQLEYTFNGTHVI